MAAVALVALSLSGCVAEPPPGPSGDDVTAFNQRLLDETWANTGLEGIAERPEVSPGAALDESEWSTSMAACMNDGGVTSFGTGYSPDTGFEFVPVNGSQDVSTAVQLLFYDCIARHPMIPSGLFEVLSDEQLNYIYDYYKKTLVPCMIMNGFTPTTAPTRVEFLAIAGQWSPYYSVDVGISGTQYEDIERICGPERPELY